MLISYTRFKEVVIPLIFVQPITGPFASVRADFDKHDHLVGAYHTIIRDKVRYVIDGYLSEEAEALLIEALRQAWESLPNVRFYNEYPRSCKTGLAREMAGLLAPDPEIPIPKTEAELQARRAQLMAGGLGEVEAEIQLFAEAEAVNIDDTRTWCHLMMPGLERYMSIHEHRFKNKPTDDGVFIRRDRPLFTCGLESFCVIRYVSVSEPGVLKTAPVYFDDVRSNYRRYPRLVIPCDPAQVLPQEVVDLFLFRVPGDFIDQLRATYAHYCNLKILELIPALISLADMLEKQRRVDDGDVVEFEFGEPETLQGVIDTFTTNVTAIVGVDRVGQVLQIPLRAESNRTLEALFARMLGFDDGLCMRTCVANVREAATMLAELHHLVTSVLPRFFPPEQPAVARDSQQGDSPSSMPSPSPFNA